MFVDITDTYAKSVLNATTNEANIKIYRLASSEVHTNVKLYNTGNQDCLELIFSYTRNCWFVHLSTPKRTIYKGSVVDIILENEKVIKLSIHTGAFKFDNLWQSVALIVADSFELLSEYYIKQINISHETRQTSVTYTFGDSYNGQYNTTYEGAELLRIVCLRLMEGYKKQQPSGLRIQREKIIAVSSETSKPVSSYDGPILTRQYNLNTKYGRKMANRQAEYNYQYGSEKYRQDIDNIRVVIWGIVLVVCAIIFILIWNTSGPEAAINWLK